LHLSSLHGPHGVGDLGREARAYVDFLARARQRYWQMLPVHPTGPGESPYSGASAFAGNPLFINLHELAREGLLTPREVEVSLPPGPVDYAAARALRLPLLRQAFLRFQREKRFRHELEEYRQRSRFWLADYALFMALARRHDGAAWARWPRGLARHAPLSLARARRELAEEVEYHEFEQLMFDRQWDALRRYANERGVGLIGDAPIFVAYESADVWGNQASFRLDAKGRPTHVSGVPPDYFSETGQRWGTPLYRWKALAREDYRFWIERFRTLLGRFDVVRLDHFIGFARYWEIAAEETTAVNGRWMKGPGRALFERVRRELGAVPFIAEDLGSVTRSVRALRDALELPGMRVFQFAFGAGDPHNEFLPHNYVPNCVAYPGTHDNDTLVAWFRERTERGPRGASDAAAEGERLLSYLAGPGATALAADVQWEVLRVLFASSANTVIVPMQDLLGLGGEARMNTPGVAEGNWRYRLTGRELTEELATRLGAYTTTYGRAPRS
jgi:4-alpha-glucanotransferase